MRNRGIISLIIDKMRMEVNDGQVIARQIIPESGSQTTEYLHRKHLNQVVDSVNYSVGFGASSTYGLPFGPGGNDQFPGHKDDPESSLHYNLARAYNPAMSRWISPDSIMAHTYDPQSLNKYGYLRNDPLNLVDPDGKTWESFTAFIIRFDEWIAVARRAEGIPYYAGDWMLPLEQSPLRPTGSWIRRLFGLESFDQRVNRALNTLEQKLAADKISEDCKQLFQTLGVSPQEYLTRLNILAFIDGTQSSDTIESQMGELYASARGVLGWTVAQVFANGFPDEPDRRVDAWTPLGGPNIYLRPGLGTNAAVIGHEIFHILNRDDGQLLCPEWGLDPNGPSSQFTDYFRDKCL